MTRFPKSFARGRILAVALMVLATLGIALLLPGRALADDDSYSIDQVDIDATVKADGSLEVYEMRDFDFDGDFHGVYWDIPRGEYNGRQIEPSIGAVGIMEGDTFVPFEQSDSQSDGTDTVKEYDSYTEVKIYSAHYDEHARFVINYTDPNLACRYNDTSEFYWKFVSDGWQVESQDVTCTVHLPVPEGASVQGGDNVRAWGHGPLDATVNFDGDDVVYKVPGVGTEEFAEARITFPAEWLSEAQVDDHNKLQSILDEEQKWADEANAKRERARLIGNVLTAVFLALAAATLVMTILKLHQYRQAHKAQFDDKYFRDVPTKDHPAVLGALLNNGKPRSEELTASIMTLTDERQANLDLVRTQAEGARGRKKQKRDYRITRTGRGTVPRDETAKRIDDVTLSFLFDKVAPLTEDGDSQTLYFGQIEKAAKHNQETYHDAYVDWQSTIEAAYESRGFGVEDNPVGKGALIALAVADIAASVLSTVLLIEGVMPVGRGLICFVLLVLMSVLSIIATLKMPHRSREAVEVTAKLEALKRWLKDFTRLEEALPQDVILWNRLLIMAVVLGVADEVIKQLRATMPQMLESPQMAPVYGWYYYGGLYDDVDSPFEAFNHSVSTAALASSPDSSGSGSGGGFSGGGGGGFGGGGGGGAF